MRLLGRVALCCLLATGLWAQHRGGGGGFRGAGGFHGARGFRGGSVRGGYGGGWVGRGPGYHSGFSSFYRSRGFYGRWGGFRGRAYVYPYFGIGAWWPTYGYGSYWGSYWSDAGYDPGYYAAPSYADPSPNITVVYPEQPAQAQTIVTVPAAYPVYAPPASTAAPAPQNSASPIYLIAFGDRTIRAALAYSVRGDTLSYIDLDHKTNQVPLSKIDRGFSLQLNRERRVPFQLPE
ncbi:MAG TPA: hypothetical protein VG672_12650 [Bryobacteraceae bacterium]|nr:hypothetical protein [Bryobacteraceae bacterium]